MHRKEYEKFSAGDESLNAADVRIVSTGLCSNLKSRSSWVWGLCLFSMILLLTGCGKKPAQAGPKP